MLQEHQMPTPNQHFSHSPKKGTKHHKNNPGKRVRQDIHKRESTTTKQRVRSTNGSARTKRTTRTSIRDRLNDHRQQAPHPPPTKDIYNHRTHLTDNETRKTPRTKITKRLHSRPRKRTKRTEPRFPSLTTTAPTNLNECNAK